MQGKYPTADWKPQSWSAVMYTENYLLYSDVCSIGWIEMCLLLVAKLWTAVYCNSLLATSNLCATYVTAAACWISTGDWRGFLTSNLFKMTVFHDEVEIEDFEYDEETETYYFPCPCGDRFAITKASSSRIYTVITWLIISR